MVIDVTGCGGACDGVVRLFSGEYSQNRKLVCNGGEQAMAVWLDLERCQSDQRTQ